MIHSFLKIISKAHIGSVLMGFEVKEVHCWYHFTCSFAALQSGGVQQNVMQQGIIFHQIYNAVNKIPGEKEYHVLFELCFCNLRFKFKFLDAPLGIDSELIIVSSFLHFARKTSANKPAMATLLVTRDHIKKAPIRAMFCWDEIYPLSQIKGELSQYKLEASGYTVSSTSIHTFQAQIKENKEKFCSLSFLPSLPPSPFFSLQQQLARYCCNGGGRPHARCLLPN